MATDDFLILCATTRLAQTLRTRIEPALSVWRTAPALTLAQWLSQLAEEAVLSGVADLPQTLDPFAEKLLWEKVIAEGLDPAAASLFDLAGMAASAADAHALLLVWKIEPTDFYELSDEARLFLGWRLSFERACRQGGWLDPASVQLKVIALLAAGHLALPARIRFAGFDRHTPLEQRLMATLAERGVQIEKLSPAEVDRGKASVLPCADVEQECAAVVRWVQAQRESHPEARLGVVAPDLAGVRDRLQFLLDDVLHPELLRPDAAEMPRCYNFSLGRALADLPLVRTALDLLMLAAGRPKVEQAKLGALLLGTGWSAATEEADGRARLEAMMRRDLGYFTTLPSLIRLAQRQALDAPPWCPQTLANLESFVVALASLPGRRHRPGIWAQHCQSLLQAVGWPGDRALSSHEYQVRRAFLTELEGLSRLDALLGPIGFSEAVRRLGQLCRQRIFQPETRGQPSLQVLGVLESAGLEFDALWVMGMNDHVWPPAPRPNPLLPAEHLRAVGAPHASAEIELDFASRVHARLLASAPVLTFSFSAVDGNRLLRPSPLIAGLPCHAVDGSPQPILARQMAGQGGALEFIEDHRAPPVGAGEKVSGGSWVLRAQAICPAWAYYQFRLGALAMETPVEGLDPAARGTLVHEALEAFWTAVCGSGALAALGPIGRPQAIAEAVRLALAHFEEERHISLPARFRELEAARLEKLLDVWLSVEARRGMAFEVLACEQPAEVEIEEIKVKMVVDRIDQLADGRQVIIDYKTGAAVDIKNWAAQRITEPQLPIYAALVNDEVAAVVFAKVLLDKPAFAGVADEKDILPGVQGVGDEKQKIFDTAEFPDWIAVITHWRERLHAVAKEIKQGEAAVSFADEKALQYCEVLPLLRLAERRRLLAEGWSGEKR